MKPISPNQIKLYRIGNDRIQAQILNFGATIFGIQTPDKHGKTDEITLGYKNPGDYVANHSAYFGSSMGRFANRIRNAHFKLGGVAYQLERNWRDHLLHGGTDNLSLRIWEVAQHTDNEVTLKIFSPDGDQGFPGNLWLNVNYCIPEDKEELWVGYSAESDRPTPVNITNHVYFNLGGQTRQNVLGHRLKIHADFFLPADEDCLPTGEVRSVKGGDFDFNQKREIGEALRINTNPQLISAGGFDHSFVVCGERERLKTAAELSDPASGRLLTVESDAPCLHFYTGNNLDATPGARLEGGYQSFSGLCFETQGYTNWPNISHFPACLVDEKHPLNQRTVFRFGNIN